MPKTTFDSVTGRARLSRQKRMAELIATGDANALDRFITSLHPADLAESLAPLLPVEVSQIFSRLPIERQAETFGHLVPSDQVGLVKLLPRAQLAAIVSEMPADERADLFNRLSPEEQETLLPALSHAEREDIRRLPPTTKARPARS